MMVPGSCPKWHAEMQMGCQSATMFAYANYCQVSMHMPCWECIAMLVDAMQSAKLQDYLVNKSI